MDNLLLPIRHFKLVNGEELVALIKEKDDGTFTLERPYVVKNNLIGGFAFLPWFPFSSQKLFKISPKNFFSLMIFWAEFLSFQKPSSKDFFSKNNIFSLTLFVSKIPLDI